MDIQTLTEKKKVLNETLSLKVAELQQMENARNQLTTEIIKMQGQVSLVEELLKAETPK